MRVTTVERSVASLLQPSICQGKEQPLWYLRCYMPLWCRFLLNNFWISIESFTGQVHGLVDCPLGSIGDGGNSASAIFDIICVFGWVSCYPGGTTNVGLDGIFGVWLVGPVPPGGTRGGPPPAPLSTVPICTAVGNCDISHVVQRDAHNTTYIENWCSVFNLERGERGGAGLP